MKNYGFLILLLWCFSLVPETTQAQGPAIVTHEMCWTTPASVDSSIIAYYIYSGRADEPLKVNYLDANGTTVDISGGGALKVGKCCCETAANSTRADDIHLSKMCWYDGSAYQSINRMVLATTTSTDPLIILYTDADGNTVDVQEGDNIYYGYCDCCTSNPN